MRSYRLTNEEDFDGGTDGEAQRRDDPKDDGRQKTASKGRKAALLDRDRFDAAANSDSHTSWLSRSLSEKA
jgi:hypothetical protein